MILTLLITILVEGAIAAGYCIWHQKPIYRLLITSIAINVFTQSLLWIMLSLFFQHYLITLFIAELFIWLIESLLLYYVPVNRLRIKDAIVLSLCMNLASFTLGWFLPI